MIDFFKKAVNDTIQQVEKYGFAYVWKKAVMEEVVKYSNFKVTNDEGFWKIEKVDNNTKKEYY